MTIKERFFKKNVDELEFFKLYNAFINEPIEDENRIPTIYDFLERKVNLLTNDEKAILRNIPILKILYLSKN